MRVEQLYPVPLKALVQELGRFKNAEMVWCQEEPRNMGAWHFIEPYLEWVLNQIDAPNKRPRYAGRAGVGGDGHRFDVEASGAAQGVAGRGAELSNLHSSCPAQAGHPVIRAACIDQTVTDYWIVRIARTMTAQD